MICCTKLWIIFILFNNIMGFAVISSENGTGREFLAKQNFYVQPRPTEILKTIEDKCPYGLNLIKSCTTCSAEIECVPQIQCPIHVRLPEAMKPPICDLPNGNFGRCCQTGQNLTIGNIRRTRQLKHFNVLLTPKIIEDGRLSFQNLVNKIEHNIAVQPGHPDFTHGLMFHSTAREDLENFQISKTAMEHVLTTQLLAKRQNIPIDDLIANNIQVGLRKTPLAQHCLPQIICLQTNSRYRTFDGSCNNPLPSRSNWGAAGQPMERLLPPAYEDGIWTPRMHATDGTRLPGARSISRLLMPDVNRPHPKYNLLLMQFGQFIAHDVTQSATMRLENGNFIDCCTKNLASILPLHSRHFACLPIEVDPLDEFYGVFGIGCLNFVRLSLVPNNECTLGYGKQRNKVTHFLDASHIYGSSLTTSRELRTFRGGRLHMLNDFGRDLLPITSDQRSCPIPGNTCFKSGDGRTNQIVSLIALHILFAREHNRIARQLERLNPHFDDETLFQEARRIVIAELQHITYNEYLPLIIGIERMKRFRLLPVFADGGYSRAYNMEINPAVTNEFSGAAFRMGHSTVDGKLQINQHGRKHADEIIRISDVMFNPSHMRIRTFYDDILNTMLIQPMQQVDQFISQDLSRFMFRGHNPFGLDLAAFNIQRGRDHALRPYNDYLELSSNRRIRNFKQLPKELANKLSQIYRSPDDIDLWVGGLLEQPEENTYNDGGGIVGYTFAEIIADQFSRFKHGDRYFYEYNNTINPGAFTLEQLLEIRKVTLARIICDNADHLTLVRVPPAAFLRADLDSNEPLNCDDARIPFVNLDFWRILA